MAADGGVLIVIASADHRGAELEGVALSQQLAVHGVPASVVALARGSGNLPVAELGGRPRSPSTLTALRQSARGARVVVAYGSTALPASAIALGGSRIPFVYRSIGDPAAWVRGRAHRARTGLLLRRAAHVVALWPGGAEAISSLYGIRSTYVSVVPNARDHHLFAPATAAERVGARAALDIERDTIVVAMICSLTPEKRVELAVDAIAHVPSGRLLVVGDGPCRGRLQARAANNRRQVRLLGRRDDVRPILHAADVIVSTSTTEGMPGALIEAALCAVPAVATDVGAVGDVVGDGGILVPASSSAADVAAAIVEVAARAECLGSRARVRAIDRFSWASVTPTWVELLSRRW